MNLRMCSRAMWALLMLGIGAAGAIEESSPTTTSDTATARGTEWLVVPMVLYTPETKLMGGISALYSFPASTRPASSVPVALLVTQKSQYFGAAAPQIFLNGGRTRIIGENRRSEKRPQTGEECCPNDDCGGNAQFTSPPAGSESCNSPATSTRRKVRT